MPIDFQPDKPKIDFQPDPKRPSFGEGVKAFFSPGGATIGEAIPIIGPLGAKAAHGAMAVIEGGLSDKETVSQAYERIKAEDAAQKAKFVQENPGAAMARGLVGGIGGLARSSNSCRNAE